MPGKVANAHGNTSINIETSARYNRIMTRLVASNFRLQGAASTWIAAYALATVYAGSTLPTPLYLDYRHAFGFSDIVLTLIYASYVLGNLTALFAFGRLSDQLGRRTVTLSALGIAVASTLLFGFAAGTAWLFGARIFSGPAIGIAAGTLTAWIAELHPAGKEGATIVTAAFNLAGLGAGAIVTGLLSRYGPSPLHFVYFVYLGALGLIAALVAGSQETVKEKTEARDVSQRPRIGVPKELRLAFVSPAATAFATFALLGFYAALAPGLLATALHQTSNAVAGAVVGELFVIATATVLVTSALPSPKRGVHRLIVVLPKRRVARTCADVQFDAAFADRNRMQRSRRGAGLSLQPGSNQRHCTRRAAR